ncbi:hypothetical protein RhoFW510R10_03460 [Rhodanobacter sp. FW510-R10]|nr:hypothetical protein RhoFW510R10_03460 [Rhodanobacter sp. FW510-R10]
MIALARLQRGLGGLAMVVMATSRPVLLFGQASFILGREGVYVGRIQHHIAGRTQAPCGPLHARHSGTEILIGAACTKAGLDSALDIEDGDARTFGQFLAQTSHAGEP